MTEITALNARIKKPLFWGLMVLIVLLGGLTLWAALAPLDSAAIAPGRVIVDTYPKDIQHLEGGIVKTIYVHEGAEVAKGDALIELDPTQAQVRAQLLAQRYYSLTALEARLIAERDFADRVNFPADLLAQKENHAEIRTIIATQNTEFATRKKRFEGVMRILHKRIDQLHEEIGSLQAQVTASKTQSSFIAKEITAVEKMVKKKYMAASELYALQREAARLEGNRGEHAALIARAKQQIHENEIQIIHNKNQIHAEVLAELRDTQDKLREAKEQMRGTQDILDRTMITAPRSGKVMNLKVHTVGGVIKPGDTLMTIVPKQDKLVIEAQVNPLDIDVVKVGLPVKVQLTAYKTRNTPALEGRVIKVSGDAVENPQTREYFYRARVLIQSKNLTAQDRLLLYPGMPVQVMIIVNRNSMLTYLFAPIKSSLTRAFREQ